MSITSYFIQRVLLWGGLFVLSSALLLVPYLSASGHKGNPFKDLQPQIDALTKRVETLEQENAA